MRKLFALLTVAAFALAAVPTFAAEEKPAAEKPAAKPAEKPAAKTEKPAAKPEKPKSDKPKTEKPKADPEAAFKRLDKDGDGSISEAEFVGKTEGEKATKAKEIFAKRDANKDGKVSLEEFKTPAKKPAK